MYFLDNNSGTPTMPALKTTQSTTPLWFTEGDGSKGISWPGQDWFNIVQAELLAILAAAGIKPEKGKLNQLALAIKATIGTDALLQKNYLSEIAKAGKDAQQKARDNLALGKLATKDKLDAGDVNAYTKQESDSRYFARGTTATTKEVAWNAASGVYNTQADGMTMVAHFAAGGTGSTRAADFRFNFGNGGLAFRSSRDGFGYENGWTKVYTDRQRPTAAEVQAADVRNNFAAKMGVNRTLLKDSQPTSAGVWSVEGNTWTPEAWGTLLCTNNRPDLKADKGNGQFHHYLFLSHSRKLWVATNVNGNWSGWQVMYSTSNKPTAADTGALPLTGGNLTGPVSSTSWLSATALTATYHTTPAGKVPEGSGAFSAQLDSKAPFYQANFDWDVTSGGHYVPLVKGRSNRKGQGYPTAVSFGYLLDGSGSFARPCIHARGDNNKDAVWQFNPNDNMLYAPGPIKAGGATLATDGNIMGSRWGNKWLWDAVIEQVNGRVDWGTYNRDVGARATIDYVNQNFVRDIRLASRGEITTDGALTEAPWGAVITGGNGNEGNQVGIMLYRYLQKNVNGNWYTVAYA